MIDNSEMDDIAARFDFMRENHPSVARELDRCLFEIMSNHAPKCGHAACDCMSMTFDRFHRERNIKFARRVPD